MDTMMTAMTQYETLGRLLCGGSVPGPGVSFEKLCLTAGLEPRLMEAMVATELGVGGDQLLGIYRSSVQNTSLRPLSL